MKKIKNFNYLLFKGAYDMCISILKNSNIDSDEKEYRINDLTIIWEDMLKKDCVNKKIYEKIHEIKSLEFLSVCDNCKISLDSKRKPGPDFKINERDWIECVASSKGEKLRYLFDEFEGPGVFDYNKIENLILCRLTGSIENKKESYFKYIDKGLVLEKDRYIIFLSAGNLYFEAFFGKYGFALNKILFGVAHKVLWIDNQNNKVIGAGYNYNDEIYNHNSQPINCNIFNSTDYLFLSGILFTCAGLDEHYNKSNTFYFSNPNAKNKVKLKSFKNIIYWNSTKKNDKLIYVPRYRGRNLNDNLSKEYF